MHRELSVVFSVKMTFERTILGAHLPRIAISTSLMPMADNKLNHSETKFSNDAFSSGQVGSKLWLCDELEKVLTRGDQNVWIYGGWHGVLGFMMLTRDTVSRGASPKANASDGFEHVARYRAIRSFDIDPSCEQSANLLCENWVWREWKFRAFTADCNQLNPAEGGEYGASPTIVINTSVEHFDQREWFEKIPEGTIVALQASDFEHDGAVSLFSTEEKMREAFPLREVLFSGRLKFDYGSWSFHRLMLIGVR